MVTPCTQKDQILTLQHNDTAIMKILEKLETKVDEIHKFIFQGEMARNYVTKEIFDMTVKDFEKEIRDKNEQINELKRNQSKVAWFIIFAVLSAIV